ncbi:MAG: ATP-binding cassette domain-containing protein [Gammaproteobacteria bacterium]|nr:ATP-binding cassette domain-containing protein [Gammaproteobacteria bacterium]
MSVIKLDGVSMAFGHVPLLDKAALNIEKGERVCLLGRNGEGKSTLLRIISGDLAADSGMIERRTDIARLSQEPQFTPDDTVFQAVAAGLGEIGRLAAEYYELARQAASSADDNSLRQLETVQHRLEAQDGWRLEQRVETVLSRLQLPANQKMGTLSGGWRRRADLARALVREADLLLLDEPTNHLDIEAIAWLEQTLAEHFGSVLFVSHDRAFIQRLATRIVALDRGCLRSYPGDYDAYLRAKSAELETEAMHAAKFDKRLAQEEVWIRQGIKARRTRNEGRVRVLQRLREERARRREQAGRMRAGVETGELSGRIVIKARGVTSSYKEKPLIEDFSTLILRGDRIGLIGPNGVGKTTLLKLLLKEMAPDVGTVRHGTKLHVAYFDQQREALNPERSVADTVGEGREEIVINGRNKHIISYLGDFLFAPERARSPVKSLSGGERNRLLLARLFTRPANVLVMDEPTNDLDVETLELLEELLAEYTGTLLLVSHDRAFLDNVVTSTLVFEGEGRVCEYAGGYQDWLRCKTGTAEPQAAEKTESGKERIHQAEPAKKAKKAKKVKKAKKSKLSYHEQDELKKLPARIESLENELAELQTRSSSADFYRQEPEKIQAALMHIKETERTLQAAYARWETLETVEST